MVCQSWSKFGVGKLWLQILSTINPQIFRETCKLHHLKEFVGLILQQTPTALELINFKRFTANRSDNYSYIIWSINCMSGYMILRLSVNTDSWRKYELVLLLFRSTRFYSFTHYWLRPRKICRHINFLGSPHTEFSIFNKAFPNEEQLVVPRFFECINFLSHW